MEESWGHNFRGTIFKANDVEGRDWKIRADLQLTEDENACEARLHSIVLAHDIISNTPVMLKISYDLDPERCSLGEGQIEKERVWSEQYFLFERELVKLVHGIGHAPELLGWFNKEQTPGMPYPGGNMDIYIMSRVPGVPVGLIVAVLEDEHLRIIRTQLTNILECMRLNRRVLELQDPNILSYDKESKKLYLWDFTYYKRITGNNETVPITENDHRVLAYGIWRDELLKEDDAEPSASSNPPSLSSSVVTIDEDDLLVYETSHLKVRD